MHRAHVSRTYCSFVWHVLCAILTDIIHNLHVLASLADGTVFLNNAGYQAGALFNAEGATLQLPNDLTFLGNTAEYEVRRSGQETVCEHSQELVCVGSRVVAGNPADDHFSECTVCCERM